MSAVVISLCRIPFVRKTFWLIMIYCLLKLTLYTVKIVSNLYNSLSRRFGTRISLLLQCVVQNWRKISINLHYWHYYVNLSNTTLLRLLMKQSKYYISNIFSIQYAEQKLILTILLFTPLTSGYFSVLVLQPQDFSIWVLFFYYIYIPSMSWVVKTIYDTRIKDGKESRFHIGWKQHRVLFHASHTKSKIEFHAHFAQFLW